MLSEITPVASSIFWILCSATSIFPIKTSTALPTSLNLSLVSSISWFCFSTDSAAVMMLSFARFVSSFNFWMISVIFAEASFVCSESWRISSATTAKPFPASPALAASIDAFRASRLVWFEMLMMESTNVFTSSTLSVRLLITSTVTWLASATFTACSFNSLTTPAPSFTLSFVLCDASIISLMPCSAWSVFPWISEHITACFWIASAVLSVLSAISWMELWLTLMDSCRPSSISIASPKCLEIFSATMIIFLLLSFWISDAFWISARFSLKKHSSRCSALLQAYAVSNNTNSPITLFCRSDPSPRKHLTKWTTMETSAIPFVTITIFLSR